MPALFLNTLWKKHRAFHETGEEIGVPQLKHKALDCSEMRVSLSLPILGNILQAELMDGGKCLMHNKVGPYVLFCFIFFPKRERGVSRGGGEGEAGRLQCILCQASHNLISDESISASFQNVGKTLAHWLSPASLLPLKGY